MRLAKHAKTANVGDGERWMSLAGGTALLLMAARRRDPAAIVSAAVGGALLYRGATGHSLLYDALGIATVPERMPYDRSVKIKKSVTVMRPVDEVYTFWRNLENLPLFMQSVDAVKDIDGRRSHWVVRGPANKRIEYDAEIIDEERNAKIGWRTVEGAQVEHAGSVRFEPALGGRGTIVRVSMQYNPPAGRIGDTVARLLGGDIDDNVEEDLRRLKWLLEAGEIPTNEGQPSGRRSRKVLFIKRREKAAKIRREDLVHETSEQSFPASDAPAWTGVEAGPSRK